MHRITLIPGDGIGPEVASAVVRIIEASGAQIEWETHVAGQQALDKFGVTLPEELLESIKRNQVGLKGPIMTPVGKGFTSVNVGLRKALDLYAGSFDHAHDRGSNFRADAIAGNQCDTMHRNSKQSAAGRKSKAVSPSALYD